MSWLERFVAFFLPLGIGLYVLISTYFGGDLSLLPGDLGDTRFNLFILEHCYQYFTGAVDQFWNSGFMYPEAEVISLSDNLLGSAPIYSFFRLIGLDIFSAFQWWVLALSVLNYVCAYLLVVYLSKKSWFSGIAAFVFAFSLGLAAQMNHAQTFPRFAIPLTLLFLFLWKDKMHWKWFFLSITSLTYTFYCGIYLGFMTFIPFVVMFSIILYSKWNLFIAEIKTLRNKLIYLSAIVVNLFLLYILFAPYLRRSKSNPIHDYHYVKESIPTIESYLSAHPGTLIHTPIENFIGGDQVAFWDHWLFSGWLATLGLAVMIILTFKKRLIERTNFNTQNTRILMITGLITFILFLRIGDYSLYYFLYQLPGFGAMRALERIINIELLFFGIGLAFILTLIANKLRNYKIFVFIFVLPLLIIDNSIDPASANTTSKEVMKERHQKLVKKMEDIPKGEVVSYEPDLNNLNTHIVHYQLDAMLAAQSLGLKSVNGYSAQAAYMFDRYWREPNPENRAYWFSRFPEVSGDDVYIVH
tara:strand:+ start:73868 stop:75451 length:1584 start_codon:yes stop_codon:yes gene_type:complete